jgi:hypothetical protein
MWCSAQSARPSLLSNIFCGLLRMHVGLILILLEKYTQKYVQVNYALLKQDMEISVDSEGF